MVGMKDHQVWECPSCKAPLVVPLELAYQTVSAHRGRAGGAARVKKMTAEALSASGKKAALARWGVPRGVGEP
jgi:hypothetical protein